MKRISVIALLTVLTAIPAKAFDINLGSLGNLAEALLGALSGDVIVIDAGASVNAGALLPLNISVNIKTDGYGAKGTLNFSNLFPGLVLNGGVGIHSGIANTVLTGKTMTGYILTNTHTLLLNSVDVINASAIYSNGDLSIMLSSLTGNTSSVNGGAIYNATGGTLTISAGTVFDSNTATDFGGAIYNEGTVTVNDSVMFSNNTAGAYGGAIYSDGNGDVTINGATFDGNSAKTGGGALYVASVGAELKINGGTTFTNNTAQNGGAVDSYTDTIFNTDAGDIIFDGNAAFEGGAFLSAGGTTLVSTAGNDLVFRNNTATGDYAGTPTLAMTVGGAIANVLEELNLNSAAGDIIFTNNRVNSPVNSTIGGMGGAIFNYHQTASISVGSGYTLEFDGNVAASSGGAIYNGGLEGITMAGTSTLTIGDNAIFTNNAANAAGYSSVTSAGMGGGAIMNYGDAVATIGDNARFESNTSALHGGAIYNYVGTVSIGGDAEFTGNTAKTYGGAIYNSGTMSINGGTSFTNNKGSEGGAIYNTGTLTFSTANGKDIDFTNNTATADAGAIYNTGTVTINSGVTFSGNTSSVAGGAISSAGTVTINGGVSFTNNKTTYYGGAIYNDLTLTLDTTNGEDINFSNNSAQMGGDIYNDMTLNILGVAGTTIDLSSAKGIHNDVNGVIMKTGENTLNITGLAEGIGAFTQTAGETISANGFFTGGAAKTNVSNSTLNVTYSYYNYGVTLGSGGQLYHTSTSTTNSSISNTNLIFQAGASDINAVFGTSGGVTGNYTLASAIENGGANNMLVVNNSNLILGANDYTGTTKYVFNNDVISLSGPDMTLRTVTFDYLESIGSTLSFDLYADVVNGVETFTSDQLVINNPQGAVEFKLGAIRLLETEDNGLTPFAIDNVLMGAKFIAGGTASIATTAYEYLVTVNAAQTGLDFDAKGASGANSLNNMNIDVNGFGTRGFNFSFFQGPQTYFIADSLGTMAEGDFTVWGHDTDRTNAVIDGNQTDSMFDVQNKTNFIISDLTIRNVLKTADSTAGAIRVQDADAVVTVNNVLFQDNKTTLSAIPPTITTGGIGGAAFWADAGTIYINNSLFTGNESERGGAMYMQLGGNLHISNTSFVGNYATVKHGGAMEISDIDAITFENMTFTDNHAPMWGGAIAFNEDPTNGGTDDFKGGINFNGTTVFTDNTAAYGGALESNMITDTAINFNGDVLFQTNIAEDTHNALGGIGAGGAIASGQDDGALNLTFNGVAQFIGNEAHGATTGHGGAMYTISTNDGVNITFNDDVLFQDNIADGFGGAIVFGDDSDSAISKLTFNMANGTVVLFDGNTASAGNDIVFYGTTSEMNINGAGGLMTLNGGIASYDDTNVINMNSSGTLEFGENSNNADFGGKFYANNGTTNIKTASWIEGDNFISNGATMHFFKTTTIDNVDIASDGNLDITGAAQNILTVKNFKSDGTGNIWLNTNGSIAGTDKLVISDTATGNAILNFAVVPNSIPTDLDIEVVDYDGAASSSMFKLAGDTLDIGAWEYTLVNKVDDGWYLHSAGDLNATAQGIKSIPATHMTIAKTGMNELRKRLGALRQNNNNDEIVGAWARGYAKHVDVKDVAQNEMSIFGIEGGIDMMKNALNGKIYFGIMGGYMASEDLRVKTPGRNGAGGTMNAPSVGAYATWIHKSNSSHKWFADLTMRHFWVETDIQRDDRRNGHNVERTFWAFTGEVGKLFYGRAPEWLNIGTLQHSHVSIEPKVELRYLHGSSEYYITNDGTDGNIYASDSFTTHLRAQANFLPNGTQSKWKPFVELGIYNEWAGDVNLTFGGAAMHVSNSKGIGFEASAGANVTLNDATYMYGAFIYEHDDVYKSYQLNLGLRMKF